MEIVKIDRKGQVILPRSVLSAAGIATGDKLAIEVTADGGILLRPAATYPIEMYTDERIAEFDSMDAMSPTLQKRLQEYLKKPRSS